MNIKTISVAVNYLDLLEYTWNYNKSEINDYTIITDSKDNRTQIFCKENDISCYSTDAFYLNGANFSKSNALNEFFLSIDINSLEWILLLDADIILNKSLERFKYYYNNQNLDSVIIPNDNSILGGIPLYFNKQKNVNYKLIYNNNQNIKNNTIHGPNDLLTEECLFGCSREVYECKIDYENNVSKFEKCFFYGYFHLFHINAIKEKILSKQNIFNHYSTADKYDMDFASEYWSFPQKKTLNFTVHHLGPIGANWSGRKSESWS
jgi:hypothetical protein